MKRIPLTQGKEALIDDVDFEYLNQFKWYALRGREGYYAACHSNGKLILMHRVILQITDPKIQGDHINRNGLDNRRRNLRISTHGQNQMNRRSAQNSSSKYLGVSCEKRRGRYKKNNYLHECIIAKIRHNGKVKYLGSFKSEENAATAYNIAARQYHGNFANFNS